MTITLKDATGASVDVKSTTDAGEEVPNHIVDTVDGAGATIGDVNDPAIITDIAGTLSGKIRGVVKQLISLVSDVAAILATITDIDNILNGTVPVNIVAEVATGTLHYHVVSAGSNNAARIKSGVGRVYGWNIYNNAAYPIYVKIYDDNDNPPTPGASTIAKVIGVPAGGGSNQHSALGFQCTDGIGIAIVKGIADADNTAVLADDCVVGLDYK